MGPPRRSGLVHGQVPNLDLGQGAQPRRRWRWGRVQPAGVARQGPRAVLREDGQAVLALQAGVSRYQGATVVDPHRLFAALDLHGLADEGATE
jgi:hypothetical protein